MERSNNFDLLRLLFASTVVMWHAYALSGASQLQFLARVFSADLAVKAFFVVSGYLVVMSCETSSSLASYAGKRVRRIYPGYVAVILACVATGAALTTFPVADYVGAAALRYLAANLAFLNFLRPTLPGVFASNPWQEVNGALWTLKIEVMFYAFVPILIWLYRRLGRATVLVSLYFLSVLYRIAAGWAYDVTGASLWLQLQRQLPGQLAFFVVGAALYLYRNESKGRWTILCALGVVSYAVYSLAGLPALRALLEPAAVGIGVVFAACGLPYLGNFARFGDMSYGVYIIHFPVIQSLIALGVYARSPVTGLGLTIALTAALAQLSWHLIEKPFLGRRSHYRLVERRTA